MLVAQIMTPSVVTCPPKADLGRAITLMLENDCGFLPVVRSSGEVVGVVTDRDIAVSLAARHRTPAHVAVEEVMQRPVHACLPDDTITTALGTMSRHRVRRLPVIDRSGDLRGVLSLDDVVLASHRAGGPRSEDIVETLSAICRHRLIEPVSA